MEVKGEQAQAMLLRGERQVPISHVVLVPDLEPLRRESPLPSPEEVVSKAKRMWSWGKDGEIHPQAHCMTKRLCAVRHMLSVLTWRGTDNDRIRLARQGFRVIPVYVTTEAPDAD